MKLLAIEKDYEKSIPLLYQILSERPLEHGISHTEMPSMQEHIEFVLNHPFRHWLLIQEDGAYIGAIECLPTNEFGIHILNEFQGKGYGKQAAKLFMETHEPSPAIPAVRNGNWLANCSPKNTKSQKFFEGLGFVPIQTTNEYRGL